MKKKIYVLIYSNDGENNILVSSYNLEKVIDYAKSFLINNLGYDSIHESEYIEDVLNSLRNDYVYKIDYLFECSEVIWRIEEIEVI